jgi:hypothetical protein
MHSDRFNLWLGKAMQSSYLLPIMMSDFILVHSSKVVGYMGSIVGLRLLIAYFHKDKLILERTDDVPSPLGCFCSQITQPRNAKLLHFYGQLKQIVKAIQWSVMVMIFSLYTNGYPPLTLCFCFMNCFAPYIDPMPSHQNSIGVRIEVHRRLQALRQILLVRGILNHWYS